MRVRRGALAAGVLVLTAGTPALAETEATSSSSDACTGDNGGISLSPGFCATVFADRLGHARHLAVAADGTVYVNTWSGQYYRNDKPPPGGFLIALRDTKGNGRADLVQRFGETEAEGAHGGTGIALYKNAVFAEVNDRIVRYDLTAGDAVPKGPPVVVLSEMPLTGDHPMHPFVIDAKGDIYLDSGSATNACQRENRMLDSAGLDPCTELETRAGTWLYDANKTGQRFSAAERFATGIRNGEGFAFDATGEVFATQHGRDQLSQNWPNLYRPEQGPVLPAEELLHLRKGADYGWPECYFDGFQKKLVLAPEYGGDGGKKVGVCAEKQEPVAFYPAHWAPNDLVIYNATQFPKPYRGGAFIAFHGSWNRAPAPQQGYNVVFQPLADDKISGDFIVFADGFAGAVKEPGQATHRPSGLAVGPDGALYISDDTGGRIWRVVYQGDAGVARIEPATAATRTAAASAPALPPEGIHPNAGVEPGPLPVPPGATEAEVALGGRIFRGEAADGTCSGCHGSDGKGSPQAPDLTNGKWLWGDGSLESITQTIESGVPKPKQFTGAMPPKGGAPLSPSEVKAVAAYVWAISHKPAQ